MRAPASTCPRLRYTHPARATFVFLAVPVPMKLNADAAVFVAVVLIAADHGYYRSLRTRDDRLLSSAYRSHGHRVRHTDKFIAVGRVRFNSAHIPGGLNNDVIDRQQNVGAAQVWVTVKIKKITGLQEATIRRAAEEHCVRFVFLDSAPGPVFAGRLHI